MSRHPGFVVFTQDIEPTDDEVRARIAALSIENTRLQALNAHLRMQAEHQRNKEAERMAQEIISNRQSQQEPVRRVQSNRNRDRYY